MYDEHEDSRWEPIGQPDAEPGAKWEPVRNYPRMNADEPCPTCHHESPRQAKLQKAGWRSVAGFWTNPTNTYIIDDRMLDQIPEDEFQGILQTKTNLTRGQVPKEGPFMFNTRTECLVPPLGLDEQDELHEYFAPDVQTYVCSTKGVYGSTKKEVQASSKPEAIEKCRAQHGVMPTDVYIKPSEHELPV